MKILCDVHISFKVAKFFQEKGIEAVHVNYILDGDHSTDQDIAAYADEHGYTVISKDNDFKNSHFIKGTPSRLLRINLGNISTKRLITILDSHFDLFIENFWVSSRCIEVYADRIEIHNE